MNNLQLYENFASEYSKLMLDYENFNKQFQKSRLDLWNKYDQTIKEIFYEMEGYEGGFPPHVGGPEATAFSFPVSWGEILKRTHKSLHDINSDLRNKLHYKIINMPWNTEKNNLKITNFIRDSFECLSKFKMLQDDFMLSCFFVISTSSGKRIGDSQSFNSFDEDLSEDKVLFGLAEKPENPTKPIQSYFNQSDDDYNIYVWFTLQVVE